MPKTYIENIQNQGGIINVHNSEINLPPHIIPQKLTPQTGLANDINFIGRKEELQKIDELLNQNSMLLLLNGIGGIGKSTLASYYLNQKKDDFDYYGFVQVNENIKLSLVSAFRISLDLKSEKIDDLFVEVMNKLQNLEGKKLLIIDDIKEMDSQVDELNTLMTLKNSNFQILFTSRETKEYIPQYFLDIMSREDAIELFLKYYPTNEIDKVDKILKYLDYHTLFIELTAKTLKQRKRTLNLDKMIEKFANGEFSSIKKNRIESFNLFLNNLFSNDKILQDKENILFLKRLSVLPSIEISFEDLYKFLVCNDEERLEDFLIELVDNGWLIESNDKYKFHQILKEFVWDNYLPTFEEIKVMIGVFSKLMETKFNNYVYVENKYEIIYLISLAKIFEKIKIENEEVYRFFIHLGHLYKNSRDYRKAEFFYKKSLIIAENIFGKDTYGIANVYYSLGSVYTFLEDYENAEKFHKQSLDITETIFGETHPDVANSYNSLGEHYRSVGEYKKAKIHYLKAVKLLPENNHIKAVVYGNLAWLYELLKEYEKSQIFHLKSIYINEKISGLDHPSTATSYNNLGSFYQLCKAYDRAMPFYVMAMKIRENSLGEEHPNTLDSYNNVAQIYELMENYEESIALYKKAITLLEKVLGKEHPDTAATYNNLAFAYAGKEKFQDAYVAIQKSIEINEKVLSKDDPNLITSKSFLEKIKKKL